MQKAYVNQILEAHSTTTHVHKYEYYLYLHILGSKLSETQVTTHCNFAFGRDFLAYLDIKGISSQGNTRGYLNIITSPYTG